MRTMRSFSFILLAACALLFGPLASAEPMPDGPGYVMPADTGSPGLDGIDAATSTASFEYDTSSSQFADPGSGYALPEQVAGTENGLQRMTYPVLRSRITMLAADVPRDAITATGAS